MNRLLMFGASLSAGYYIGEQLPSPYKGIKLKNLNPPDIHDLAEEKFEPKHFKKIKSSEDIKSKFLTDYSNISDLFISKVDKSIHFAHTNETKSQGIRGITHGGFTFSLQKFAFEEFLKSVGDEEFKYREVYVRYKKPCFCNEDFYLEANYAYVGDNQDRKIVKVTHLNAEGNLMGYSEFR